ncbi:MAG: hypothetical protein ACREDX_04750 [Aestuariivirga sp.]
MAGMFVFAVPALAQNYDYLSRSDGISLSGGDSSRANIAIQTPTPWPPYVNNTRIYGNGRQGADLMERYLGRYSPQQQNNPSTVINITSPANE